MRPGAVFDLGNQGRAGEHQVLARHAHWRRSGLQPIERLAQLPCLVVFEAGSNTADIDIDIAPACCQQQAGNGAGEGGRRFIADDDKAVALATFDFQPVTGPARTIGPVTMLGDDALKPQLAGVRYEIFRIRIDLLRKADHVVFSGQGIFEQMPTNAILRSLQVMAIEIQKIEGIENAVARWQFALSPAAGAQRALQKPEIRPAGCRIYDP